MEVLGVPALMKYGTGVVVLFLLLLNVYMVTVLNSVSKSLFELKKNVVFKETYNDRIAEIIESLKEIRRKVFNGSSHEN